MEQQMPAMTHRTDIPDDIRKIAERACDSLWKPTELPEYDEVERAIAAAILAERRACAHRAFAAVEATLIKNDGDTTYASLIRKAVMGEGR